jgi:hypothetical protein
MSAASPRQVQERAPKTEALERTIKESTQRSSRDGKFVGDIDRTPRKATSPLSPRAVHGPPDAFEVVSLKSQPLESPRDGKPAVDIGSTSTRTTGIFSPHSGRSPRDGKLVVDIDNMSRRTTGVFSPDVSPRQASIAGDGAAGRSTSSACSTLEQEAALLVDLASLQRVRDQEAFRSLAGAAAARAKSSDNVQARRAALQKNTWEDLSHECGRRTHDGRGGRRATKWGDLSHECRRRTHDGRGGRTATNDCCCTYWCCHQNPAMVAKTLAAEGPRETLGHGGSTGPSSCSGIKSTSRGDAVPLRVCEAKEI